MCQGIDVFSPPPPTPPCAADCQCPAATPYCSNPATANAFCEASRCTEAFGDQVFHTVIGRTVRFPETTVAGEPITTYASSHAGAYAYRLLARELIARGDAA